MLTAVAVANFLFAIINLLAGSYFLWIISIDLTADFRWNDSPDTNGLGLYIRIFLWGRMSIFKLMSLGAAGAGIGIQRRRKWGRVLTIVLGFLVFPGMLVLMSLPVPLGLFCLPYAVFVLTVLLSRRSAAAFR